MKVLKIPANLSPSLHSDIYTEQKLPPKKLPEKSSMILSNILYTILSRVYGNKILKCVPHPQDLLCEH